jgi:lipoyl-dependent peroxiredoxin
MAQPQTIDIKRTAKAAWNGGVPQGSGSFAVGSGAIQGKYSFNTRMGDEPGTNPEELIGAAHAACFSMALSFALTNAGHAPTSVLTSAVVHLTRTDTGFAIPKIELTTEGVVPGIDEATFRSTAEDAKKNCPVSKALAGVDITLQASLKPA